MFRNYLAICTLVQTLKTVLIILLRNVLLAKTNVENFIYGVTYVFVNFSPVQAKVTYVFGGSLFNYIHTFSLCRFPINFLSRSILN